MKENVYLIRVGFHTLMLNSLDEAVSLLKLLSSAQPVDFDLTHNQRVITHASPIDIEMKVRPVDEIDPEHL